ncbi:hypothetical protein RRG08_066773 [Elysia crispata]|uniref:Uncharacterized protein n=1 Tax=Elysia crispata TaxID=231223 RepID=A0AAE0XPG8_9GAST|nr:hypothetical protein RRG08_066773 [Elysia crispata]
MESRPVVSPRDGSARFIKHQSRHTLRRIRVPPLRCLVGYGRLRLGHQIENQAALNIAEPDVFSQTLAHPMAFRVNFQCRGKVKLDIPKNNVVSLVKGHQSSNDFYSPKRALRSRDSSNPLSRHFPMSLLLSLAFSLNQPAWTGCDAIRVMILLIWGNVTNVEVMCLAHCLSGLGRGCRCGAEVGEDDVAAGNGNQIALFVINVLYARGHADMSAI